MVLQGDLRSITDAPFRKSHCCLSNVRREALIDQIENSTKHLIGLRGSRLIYSLTLNTQDDR